MSAIAATPPTTPPTMAPMGVFFSFLLPLSLPFPLSLSPVAWAELPPDVVAELPDPVASAVDDEVGVEDGAAVALVKIVLLTHMPSVPQVLG